MSGWTRIEIRFWILPITFYFFASANDRLMILKDVVELIAYFTKSSSEVNFLLAFSTFVQFLAPDDNKGMVFTGAMAFTLRLLHFFFRAVTVAARSRPDSRFGVNCTVLLSAVWCIGEESPGSTG